MRMHPRRRSALGLISFALLLSNAPQVSMAAECLESIRKILEIRTQHLDEKRRRISQIVDLPPQQRTIEVCKIAEWSRQYIENEIKLNGALGCNASSFLEVDLKQVQAGAKDFGCDLAGSTAHARF
jgi:hypothetical protein